MLDEFGNRLNPPCHELLRPEELQLFLVRFLGKDAGDFYQVSPGIDKGVKGINLFLGEPLPRMMLQASYGQIAILADAAFLGKCFELQPDFIGTPEGVYSGCGSLDNTFLLHVNEFLMKGNEYKLVRKKDMVCEPASSLRNF